MWQPIETAPTDKAILLWYPWQGPRQEIAPPGFMYIGRWLESDGLYGGYWIDPADCDPIGPGATHWMPLPTHPQ